MYSIQSYNINVPESKRKARKAAAKNTGKKTTRK